MLIELVNVSFTYLPGTSLEQVALKDVDLKIGEGDFIGLIGPTGSGKSTLIQHLNGLLTPTQGRVLFEGKEIGKDVHPRLVREEVGLVFQFPESQLFADTVVDDVSFGPRNLGLSDKEARVRAKEAIESVGLDFNKFADRPPFSLSGGEKRLVAIAGVLAMRPRVLVLDEPVSGLDVRGKAKIMRILDELNKAGMTIIIAAHDMDEIAEHVGRIVVVNGGRVVLDGCPKVVFSELDTIKGIGLDLPKPVEVLLKLKECGFNISVDSLSLKGVVSTILAAVKERQCL
ncbi:MAG: energy-coupling factor transporter ATPase [Firmicutes bacterium]|nr:energy-coupling factor transporter ATPase [Bacillota bacterium]